MLNFYKWATIVIGPAARLFLHRRASLGKEDLSRLSERFGFPSLPRPAGSIGWGHAASGGESLSVVPLIQKILAALPKGHVLITTGTVASARLLQARLPAQSIHQFVPIDHPKSVCRFLDYWAPDLAIWVESELWPNLLNATHDRKISSILVQGRMSKKSYRYWRWLPGLIVPLLSKFDEVFVQTKLDGVRFKNLGAINPKVTGTLKYSAPLLVADEGKLQCLRELVGIRPLWLAASVHPGEFELICDVHSQLQKRFSNLLMVVVPRHPSNTEKLKLILEAKGLVYSSRSLGEALRDSTSVYIGDTMGELGLFYRLSNQAFIGGSFVRHGGQNPIEAIQLNCAIMAGPYMFNFSEIVEDFDVNDASLSLSSKKDFLDTLTTFLESPEFAQNCAEKQQKVIAKKSKVLESVFQIIAGYLPVSE